MISTALVTHRATVTRQGTRTSDAGDTVTDGIFAAIGITDVPCIAEEVGGAAPARQQRTQATGTWVVLVNPGLDIRPRDRITLTSPSGRATVAAVIEVRDYDVPARVAHSRLTCEEVTG